MKKYKNLLILTKAQISAEMNVIGNGSSRSVYNIDDNAVIKYAKSQTKGKAQNQTEYNIFTHAKDEVKFLCPISGISKDFNIVIMAKAVPLNKIKDLGKEAQKEVREFKKMLKNVEKTIFIESCEYYSYSLSKEEITKTKRTSLYKGIISLIKNYKLTKGDIFRMSSWGYYKERVVLIDYGCTEYVYNSYYNKRLPFNYRKVC